MTAPHGIFDYVNAIWFIPLTFCIWLRKRKWLKHFELFPYKPIEYVSKFSELWR